MLVGKLKYPNEHQLLMEHLLYTNLDSPKRPGGLRLRHTATVKHGQVGGVHPPSKEFFLSAIPIRNIPIASYGVIGKACKLVQYILVWTVGEWIIIRFDSWLHSYAIAKALHF